MARPYPDDEDEAYDARGRVVARRPGGLGAPAPVPTWLGGMANRARGGLAKGGIVGGLAGAAGLDPASPWMDVLTGTTNALGLAMRASYGQDPGHVDRVNLGQQALGIDQIMAGIHGLNAESGARRTDLLAKADERTEALLAELQAKGLDPSKPGDLEEIKRLFLRHGQVDALVRLLGQKHEQEVPKKIDYFEGEQKVTEIYDPDGTKRVITAPRKVADVGGGGDLGDYAKLDQIRRQNMKPLLDARVQNQRVVAMLDNALKTGNPVQALAGIRTFISAVDQSVVREEETAQFFGSLGVFKTLVGQIERAGGKPPSELVQQTRAAAKAALDDLNQIIIGRDMQYRELAERSGIDASLLGIGSRVSPLGGEEAPMEMTNGVPVGTTADGLTIFRNRAGEEWTE